MLVGSAADELVVELLEDPDKTLDGPRAGTADVFSVVAVVISLVSSVTSSAVAVCSARWDVLRWLPLRLRPERASDVVVAVVVVSATVVAVSTTSNMLLFLSRCSACAERRTSSRGRAWKVFLISR